jgi:hypothetical protein
MTVVINKKTAELIDRIHHNQRIKNYALQIKFLLFSLSIK